MFSRLDLRPQKSTKITLFANTAEAVVFWLAAAGLILLGIISLFRYLSGQDLASLYRQQMAAQARIVKEIENLKQENQFLQNKLDSMQIKLQRMEAEIRNQESKAAVLQSR